MSYTLFSPTVTRVKMIFPTDAIAALTSVDEYGLHVGSDFIVARSNSGYYVLKMREVGKEYVPYLDAKLSIEYNTRADPCVFKLVSSKRTDRYLYPYNYTQINLSPSMTSKTSLRIRNLFCIGGDYHETNHEYIYGIYSPSQYKFRNHDRIKKFPLNYFICDDETYVLILEGNALKLYIAAIINDTEVDLLLVETLYRFSEFIGDHKCVITYTLENKLTTVATSRGFSIKFTVVAPMKLIRYVVIPSANNIDKLEYRNYSDWTDGLGDRVRLGIMQTGITRDSHNINRFKIESITLWGYSVNTMFVRGASSKIYLEDISILAQ